MTCQIILTGADAEQFVRQLIPQLEVRVDERTFERLKAALPAEPEPAPDAMHYEDDPVAVADLSGCYPRDLTGMRFGQLVVTGKSPWGPNSWRVSCDCGLHTVRTRQELLSGSDTSCCGCEPKPEEQTPTRRRRRPSQEDSIQLCHEYLSRWELIARSSFSEEQEREQAEQAAADEARQREAARRAKARETRARNRKAKIAENLRNTEARRRLPWTVRKVEIWERARGAAQATA